MTGALKTKKTDASVAKFLDAIPDATMRADCRTVAKMMERVTKAKPKMWGSSIVGFGTSMYEGRTGAVDWMLVGFSPRKVALTLYIMTGVDRHPALFQRLGKFKTGKACLYLKRLADVDVKVLEQIVKESVMLITRAQTKSG